MFGGKRGLFFTTVSAVVGLTMFVKPGLAQKNAAGKSGVGHAQLASTVPVVGRAVGFGESRPVRELMNVADAFDLEMKQKAKEINELNAKFSRTERLDAPPQKDGMLQSSFGVDGHLRLNIPTPILTFEGVGVNGSAPPDTVGAVGPNDYMEAVNGGGVRIYDKAGNPRGPAFRLSSLFAPLGGVPANTDNGDALVLYDRMADRWLITQFAFASSTTPPYHQPMAVSKTGDPTGAYWVYNFITPGNEFPDYGKIGTWPDGYYFTDRQFTNGAAYNGFGVFAFDRAKMLVGDSSATYLYFNAGPTLSNSSSGMIPSDYNGLTPPPAGAPNVFSVFLDDAFDAVDALRLFDFHADFANPASSTFLERPESPLAVAAFDSRNPSGRADVEQPSPAVAADYLDTIGDRLMLRLQYINRNGQELLTTCHTVNGGTIPAAGVNPTVAEYRAATRHYVLQKTSPTGPWSVLDQATFSPDSTERWMGSTALDSAGNLAVGYSTSSLSVVPSIAYSGRLASDPPNTLAQGEATMFAGTGVQTGTANRWGDYTAMTLDPVDDATFWYCNEYYNPTGAFLWRTRIGAFKFPNTVAPPQGTLTGTITACDSGVLLRDAVVTVTGGPSTGFSGTTKADGTYAFKLSPGTYSATISDPAHNCAPAGPFSVVVTNGGTTILNGCLTGTARLVFAPSNPTVVSATGGNGNAVIEPSECNTLNVSLLNDGCLSGSGISGVLSTTTPGVTITQANSLYPNAPAGAATTNSTPFQISTSAGFSCGTPINLTFSATYSGGGSLVQNFTLATCNAPPMVVNGILTTGDLVQEGRMGRNAVVSNCGTAKPCPTIFGSGNRRYDVLTFANGPGAACATITTTAPGGTGTPVVPVAYLNSYTPPGVGTGGNICLNYLGDPGGSPNTVNSFSVDVPANATLVVVVQDANANQANSSYSVQVAGLVGNGVGPGPCIIGPTIVSRKAHGGVGTFDIPLPYSGTGVEDRTGNGGVAGTHTIVLTYPSSPSGSTASILSTNPAGGAGSVSNVTYQGNDMLVTLTGVSDKQVLKLATIGGNVTSEIVPIGFLVGDTNGNRNVSGTDVSQTKAGVAAGIPDGMNFRTDVNANGAINATDVSLVKAASGNTLP